jgi:hypothetical protein
MPDTPVEPSPSGRYPLDMESRVAVLEEIARNTALTLARIERWLDGVDHRFDTLASTHRADFRWLVGIMFGGFSATIAGFATMLGVMAPGFHWL